MRRGVALAAVLALWSLIPARAWGAPARGENLENPAALAAHATDIRVERRRWDEANAGARPEASARASREWLQQLVAVGLHDSTRSPRGSCLAACRRCPDQLSVDVSFSVESRLYTLTLHMQEGLAFLRSQGAEAWTFTDSIHAVHRLVRAVMPEDAYVRDWMPPSKPMPLEADSATEGDDILVTGGPEPIRKVPPAYPDPARERNVTGLVQVRALVGTDGTVEQARVARSVALLDQAATDAVRQWTFKPAICGTRPVAVWVTIPVRFSIH